MSYGKTFKKSTGGDFQPIPKGRYACVIDNVTIEEVGAKKTPCIQIVSIIDGGAHDKRKLWTKLWMTDGAYDMVAQQLENLMLFDALPESSTITEFQDAAADLLFKIVGKKIEVSVTGHDEYNGKTYEKTFLTMFLDVPNAAFQNIPKYGEDVSAARPPSAGANVDSSEPLPF